MMPPRRMLQLGLQLSPQPGLRPSRRPASESAQGSASEETMSNAPPHDRSVCNVRDIRPSFLKLGDIDACVFDAYGTLFDTSSAANRCRETLGDAWQSFAQLWRRKQLEYSWLRSLMGRHTDFWHVTAEALDYTFAAFRRNDPQLRALLMQQYLSLEAYPGVR